MNIVSYAFSRFVGIDVSKGTLDIASAECQSATIANTKKEINRWISSLIETANKIVVMEATGGYESLLVKLLHERKVALAVVNPRQVRDSHEKAVDNPQCAGQVESTVASPNPVSRKMSVRRSPPKRSGSSIDAPSS